MSGLEGSPRAAATWPASHPWRASSSAGSTRSRTPSSTRWPGRGRPSNATARELQGKVAIANAKLAYQRFKASVATDRWMALAAQEPACSGCCGRARARRTPSTANSCTWRADRARHRRHGAPGDVRGVPPPRPSAREPRGGRRGGAGTLAALDELGISLEAITDQLTADGVDLFTQAFEKLFAAIAGELAQPAADAPSQRAGLPPEIETEVRDTIDDWQSGSKVRRLWAGDHTLWTGADESDWLGWLHVAEEQAAHSERLDRIARRSRGSGLRARAAARHGWLEPLPGAAFAHLPARRGHPQLRILDSTDPAQVSARERELDLAAASSSSPASPARRSSRTSSSSTSSSACRTRSAPARLRDASSRSPTRLQARAAGRGAGLSPRRARPRVDRRAILGPVGLRHAAGRRDGRRRAGAARPCRAHGAQLLPLPSRPPTTRARAGFDHRRVRPPWARQAHPRGVARDRRPRRLARAALAESTGKDGKGVIPIDREPLGRRTSTATTGCSSTSGSGRAQTKHRTLPWTRSRRRPPVVRIGIDDLYDIGGELFRWEFATAVAGSVIGINPFDQPDVEASKVVTRDLTDAYERHGKLPDEELIATFDGTPCTRTSATPPSFRPQPARTPSRGFCERTWAGSASATTLRCWRTSR